MYVSVNIPVILYPLRHVHTVHLRYSRGSRLRAALYVERNRKLIQDSSHTVPSTDVRARCVCRVVRTTTSIEIKVVHGNGVLLPPLELFFGTVLCGGIRAKHIIKWNCRSENRRGAGACRDLLACGDKGACIQ